MEIRLADIQPNGMTLDKYFSQRKALVNPNIANYAEN